MYVSVTGLRVLPGQRLRFHWHAFRSIIQARSAAGNTFADARTRNGVQHTLTVWRDREAMRAYMVSGAHLKAMKAFRKIGHGKVVGYEASVVPSWDEALARWDSEAREV